jgi:hypothetical protein
VNHVDFGSIQGDVACRELQESLAALTANLGTRRRPFAFPWGGPDEVPTYAPALARRIGYYAALANAGGSNTRGVSPWRLQRVDVGNGELSGLTVRARIAGLDMDHVRARWRLWRGGRFIAAVRQGRAAC